ncbi:hypothetical protein ABK040_000780 [Willaertia magna]
MQTTSTFNNPFFVNNCEEQVIVNNNTQQFILSNDIWIEIFSFFTTFEKLNNLILISKRLQFPIYQSILKLQLTGIESLQNNLQNNNTTTVTKRNRTLRRRTNSNPNLQSFSQLEENKIQLFVKDYKNNILYKILEPFPCLYELHFEFCKVLNGTILQLILEKFIYLKKLIIVHCNELKEIKIENCKNLIHLEIRDCKQLQQLQNINCTQLISLNLSNCNGLTNQFISNLLEKNCNTLQYVNLSGILNLNEISICKTMNALLYFTMKRCKNFNNFNFPLKNTFPNLLELDLSSTGINDQTLQKLTTEQSLQKLHTLFLEGCKSLKKPILGPLQNLQKLSLDLSTELQSLQIPPNHCPNLTYLSLSNTNITDQAIEKILQNNYLQYDFNDLTENTTFGGNNGENFINGNVVGGNNGVAPIRKLILKKCRMIQNPTIFSNVLEELDLHGCYNCNSPKILKKCNSLQKLNLGWTRVTDEELQNVLNSCPKINELNCNTCDLLQNPMIISNNLQAISFQGAHELQNPIFKCKSLKSLDFTNCTKLENPTLFIFSKKLEKEKKAKSRMSFLGDKEKSKSTSELFSKACRKLNFDEEPVDLKENNLTVASNSSGNSGNSGGESNNVVMSTTTTTTTTIEEEEENDNKNDNNGLFDNVFLDGIKPMVIHPKLKVLIED